MLLFEAKYFSAYFFLFSVLFNIFILPLVTHFLLFHRILTHIALTLALHNSLESGIRDEREGDWRTSRELGKLQFLSRRLFIPLSQERGNFYPSYNTSTILSLASVPPILPFLSFLFHSPTCVSSGGRRPRLPQHPPHSAVPHQS
jgi:hypothetical protein